MAFDISGSWKATILYLKFWDSTTDGAVVDKVQKFGDRSFHRWKMKCLRIVWLCTNQIGFDERKVVGLRMFTSSTLSHRSMVINERLLSNFCFICGQQCLLEEQLLIINGWNLTVSILKAIHAFRVSIVCAFVLWFQLRSFNYGQRHFTWQRLDFTRSSLTLSSCFKCGLQNYSLLQSDSVSIKKETVKPDLLLSKKLESMPLISSSSLTNHLVEHISGANKNVLLVAAIKVVKLGSGKNIHLKSNQESQIFSISIFAARRMFSQILAGQSKKSFYDRIRMLLKVSLKSSINDLLEFSTGIECQLKLNLFNGFNRFRNYSVFTLFSNSNDQSATFVNQLTSDTVSIIRRFVETFRVEIYCNSIRGWTVPAVWSLQLSQMQEITVDLSIQLLIQKRLSERSVVCHSSSQPVQGLRKQNLQHGGQRKCLSRHQEIIDHGSDSFITELKVMQLEELQISDTRFVAIRVIKYEKCVKESYGSINQRRLVSKSPFTSSMFQFSLEFLYKQNHFVQKDSVFSITKSFQNWLHVDLDTQFMQTTVVLISYCSTDSASRGILHKSFKRINRKSLACHFSSQSVLGLQMFSNLQNRSKCFNVEDNLKVGELVILKEDNIPPTKWQLGRIIEVHPSRDGLVRVVTVRLKCKHHTLTRPIHKLCRLPFLKPNELEVGL